jgi:predicted O-methyltransferase YrrM
MARKAPAGLTMLLRRERDMAQLTGLLKDVCFAVSPDVGQFLYLTVLALGARSIVEFGTSFGVSTVYLAAAAGHTGGTVVTSELEPSKAAAAAENVTSAGLGAYVDIRVGDALETLRDTPAPVDLVLLDGWKPLYLPVLELLTPSLRPGAVVLADDVDMAKEFGDYLERVRSPAGPFRSVTIPLGEGLEYSYYAGDG